MLIGTTNDTRFHEVIEELRITAETITVVESMSDHLVGVVLLETKQAVGPHKISDLRIVSSFKDYLIHDSSYNQHDACLRHCRTLSTLLHTFFIKPSFT